LHKARLLHATKANLFVGRASGLHVPARPLQSEPVKRKPVFDLASEPRKALKLPRERVSHIALGLGRQLPEPALRNGCAGQVSVSGKPLHSPLPLAD
jgi:hypothetical protein